MVRVSLVMTCVKIGELRCAGSDGGRLCTTSGSDVGAFLVRRTRRDTQMGQ